MTSEPNQRPDSDVAKMVKAILIAVAIVAVVVGLVFVVIDISNNADEAKRDAECTLYPTRCLND